MTEEISVEKYMIPDGARRFLESLPLPIAVYQMIDDNLTTLLVSDGLVQMEGPGQTREGLMWLLDHEMFRNSEPSDTLRILDEAKRFTSQGVPFRALYREKLYGKDTWSMLYSQGYHIYLGGVRLAVVYYTDLTTQLEQFRLPQSTEWKAAREFFQTQTGAMAVISRKSHILYYYNEALCRMLPPKKKFDIGSSFEEFFFDLEPGDQILKNIWADSGVQEMIVPGASKFYVTMNSTIWKEDPSYLLYFFEAGETKDREKVESEGAFSAFAQFLQTGMANDREISDPGYQGYLIFNLTKGIVEKYGNVPDLPGINVAELSYDGYCNALRTYAADAAGIAMLDSCTSDYYRKTYQTNSYQRSFEMFYKRLSGKKVRIRSDVSMMKSPVNGDLYLKIQNEEVTEKNIMGALLQTVIGGSFDFIAYIDVLEDYAFLMDPEVHSYQFTGNFQEILLRLGLLFENFDSFLEFLDQQSAKPDTEYVNRKSGEGMKIIHVWAASREEKRYYLSCASISEDAVRKSNLYDALTGLPNLNYINDQVGNYLARMEEAGAVLYFDIVNMKGFNEKYGYRKGTDLIEKASRIIADAFSGFLTARISDDHFVVLTSLDGMVSRIKRCCEEFMEISHDFPLRAGIFKITDPKNADFMAACDCARLACRELEKRSDHSYWLYDEKIREKYSYEKKILAEFDHALKSGSFRIYYQPVVRSSDGSTVHYEGLCRWLDESTGNFISPSLFIPVLEEHHLITRLDFFMVEQMCKDMRAKMEAGTPLEDLHPVSINFSALDFESDALESRISEILARYGIPAKMLCVEITERVLAKDSEYLKDQIRNLRQEGYEVWMDDFGSAFSSLNTLGDYEFDVLKIDIKFIRRLGQNSKNEKIVSSVIQMAKKLGMTTVAEGVETEKQRSFLAEESCDYLQGFYFSKPMPFMEL